MNNYFKKKYFCPEIYTNISKKLLSIANTSIDISDGLIADLEKLINKQKLSYILYFKDIPVSKNLKKLINLKRSKNKHVFHVVMITKSYLLPLNQNLESLLKLLKH